MNRTANLKVVQLLLAVAVALPALIVGGTRAMASVSEPNRYYFNFDKTADPWRGASYIENPDDYLGMLQPVLSLGGDAKSSYALLNTNGADAAWMQASFRSARHYLTLNLDVMDVYNGGRLAPMIYVGKEAPKTPYQFQLLGAPLAKGPQTLYHYVDLAEMGLQNQQFVIAIGFLNLDNERVEQEALVDNIRIYLHDGD